MKRLMFNMGKLLMMCRKKTKKCLFSCHNPPTFAYYNRTKERNDARRIPKRSSPPAPESGKRGLAYVRRADVAEDIVQDCLVRLWDMCGDLRSPMAALARIVTRNLCLDFVRRTPHTEDVALLPQVDEADGTAERHEAVDRMMDIVTELPLVQQTVLRMRHIEGRDMAYIAHTLGMNEATARKALSRALMAVRNEYVKRYQEKAI